MLNRFLAASLVLTLLTAPVAAQDTDPFMRHPSVHPDGNRIAFSYQGDLWTVPLDGGAPERRADRARAPRGGLSHAE